MVSNILLLSVFSGPAGSASSGRFSTTQRISSLPPGLLHQNRILTTPCDNSLHVQINNHWCNGLEWYDTSILPSSSMVKQRLIPTSGNKSPTMQKPAWRWPWAGTRRNHLWSWSGQLDCYKRRLQAHTGLQTQAPNPGQCLQPHKTGVLTLTLGLQTLWLSFTYSVA